MANAYSAVFLAKDLYEKGDDTGVKMQKTLSTLIKGWAGGALGDVALDANGDIVWKTFSVHEVKDGEVVEKSAYTIK